MNKSIFVAFYHCFNTHQQIFQSFNISSIYFNLVFCFQFAFFINLIMTLTPDQRAQVIYLTGVGMKPSEIGKIVNCHPKTVKSIMIKFNQTGSIASRTSSGN
jgi:hypothetical protein